MLPDRAVLTASDVRSRRVAAAWRAGEPHRRIDAAVGRFDPADIGRIADAAEALLADPDWIAALLAPLVAALGEDPWFEPPLRVARDAQRTGAVLWHGATGKLIATVLTAGSAADDGLVASGRLAITRYHRAGGARLEERPAGPPIEGDAAPLGPAVVHGLADGEVRRLDGRTTAFRLIPGTDDTVLLTFTLQTATVPFVRAYDGAGRPTRLAARDDTPGRTAMLLTLLRACGRADAAPAFERATRDPAFFLRWQAMREWLALDARGALPRLAEMRDDPHPEVRAAARATHPAVESRLCLS